ncbi:MAG: MFS transporter [Pseudomonadales bacterium]|nr:MFS transporter [Pseudomonadales bacterium]
MTDLTARGNAETQAGVVGADRLKWSVIVAYGAPGVGAGYMYLLLGLYIMKFSTDVLLIAPAVMGTIFGISRVWDAVSDPLVGYMSDRTSSRLGRRRSWLLFSIVPLSLTFIWVFSPPESMTGVALIAWMAFGVIGFYSAATVFIVPHMSLGAELTPNYHERSRLYGLRHAAFTAGSIFALVSMYLLIAAEQKGESVVRLTAFQLSTFASVLTAVLIFYAVYKLRERADFQGRVNANPFGAFNDVWQNVHARLVIIATFIENIGSAVIGILTLYIAQYVVGRPELAAFIILSYMVPSTFSVPLWIPLSRRFGKIRLWVFSLLLTGVSFGGMFLLPFLEQGSRVGLIFFLAVFAGLAAGCGGTIAPSIQSDIIDYDEYMTGERKEGSYFAAFNFVYKSATGVMIFIAGYVLQFAGFVPNQEQTMTVQVAMVTLYGLFPLVCCTIGAIMLTRLTLDEAAHSKLREELDARASAG